jgi:hypothetical protein
VIFNQEYVIIRSLSVMINTSFFCWKEFIFTSKRDSKRLEAQNAWKLSCQGNRCYDAVALTPFSPKENL